MSAGCGADDGWRDGVLASQHDQESVPREDLVRHSRDVVERLAEVGKRELHLRQGAEATRAYARAKFLVPQFDLARG